MMSQFKTLLMAHHTGDDPATRQAIRYFAEQVTLRSGGVLNIADMPGSALGNIPAMLQMCINGQADMVLAPFDRISDLLPKFGCVGMPYVFDDLAHADRVLNGPFADWAMPDLQQRGLHSLSAWEWGFRQLSNNRRPIHTPEDLQGLRIRVPPIRQYQEAMLALGCMPVIVEFAQLASVIRQGLVDGQENPIAVIHAYRLHENQQYLSLLNYSYGGMLHIINRASYEALSNEHRQIISEASCEAACRMREHLRSQQINQIDELQTFGMQIVEPPLAAFRACMGKARKALAEHFGSTRTASFFEMVEYLREPTTREDKP